MRMQIASSHAGLPRPMLAFLLLWASVVGSANVRADTYVVVPLVGDRITVFVAKTKITAGAQAERRLYATNDPLLDTAAFSATDSAIHKLRADASVVMLRVNDRALYGSIAPRLAAQDWSSVDAVMASLSPDIAKSASTRLVLIVPQAGQIKLPLQSSGGRTASLPQVVGLGFYLDNVSYYFTSDSAVMHSPGMVMSFASFSLFLANPATHSIEGGRSIVVYRMLPAPDSNPSDPWESLTPQQKTDALRQLLDDGIGRMVPALFMGPGAR